MQIFSNGLKFSWFKLYLDIIHEIHTHFNTSFLFILFIFELNDLISNLIKWNVKIIGKMSWAWFLLVLRTKEAHKRLPNSCIRSKGQKDLFWERFDKIFKEIFWHSKQYIPSLFLTKLHALYILYTITCKGHETLSSYKP